MATTLLARDLLRLVTELRPDAVIAQTPWQWPAVSALTGTRRILETTDDWGALMPDRRADVAALQRRAAAEIAKESWKTGRTVRELAREKGVLPPDELERALDARAMTEGGVRG
jgi:hypothetical protein